MTGLAKSLTPLRGAALMLNIVIGAGLLAIPGLVVEQAGTLALWSWLLCAALAFPLLLVFVLMGRSHPHAGGVAHFARLAFGQPLYIISSLLFLGAVILGLPAIALTGGHYLAEILPGAPAFHAIALVVTSALVQLLSADHAAKFSSAVSSLILLALIVITGLGMTAVNWSDVPDRIAPIYALNFATVSAPVMMIFFAFTGWEVAASLSEEFKNPKTDFPIAMGLSFIAALVLYFMMAFIAQMVTNQGAPEAVFTSIITSRFGSAAGVAMSLVAVTIIFANLMGAVWAVSRMVYALSREGLIVPQLETNIKGVPISAVILTVAALVGVIFADWLGYLSIKTMLHLAGQNFLILYGIVACALMKLTANTKIRVMSGFVALMTIVLLLFQGVTLAYPLIIIAIALVSNAWILKQRAFS